MSFCIGEVDSACIAGWGVAPKVGLQERVRAEMAGFYITPATARPSKWGGRA
jgi:hypothetical protein